MLNISANPWDNKRSAGVLETLVAPLTTQTVGGGHVMADSQRSRFTDKQIARFWSRVEKSDGCWLWTGLVDEDGYGEFRTRNSRRAHRLSWELANGSEPPRGLLLCHTCDNRLCVRPDHLFSGTHRDNLDDAVKKGRIVRDRCKRGHVFTADNTRWYTTPDGYRARHCRVCVAIRQLRENERMKMVRARRRREGVN